MVRHIVMWKLKEFASAEERAEAVRRIKNGLEALVGVVDGLMCAQVGENFNEDYDLCLYSEFRDRESLAAYRDHPEHRKTADYVATVRVARASCDWEMEPSPIK